MRWRRRRQRSGLAPLAPAYVEVVSWVAGTSGPEAAAQLGGRLEAAHKAGRLRGVERSDDGRDWRVITDE